jgi:hypothetical protein
VPVIGTKARPVESGDHPLQAEYKDQAITSDMQISGGQTEKAEARQAAERAVRRANTMLNPYKTMVF